MTINADAPRPAPWMIMWLTWPLLFIVGTGGNGQVSAAGFTYWLFNGIFVGFCIAIFLTLEFKFPVRRTWMMTKRSFTRDLKYFAMSIVMLGAINTGLGYISIKAGAGNTGPITDWPLLRFRRPSFVLSFRNIGCTGGAMNWVVPSENFFGARTPPTICPTRSICSCTRPAIPSTSSWCAR